MSDEQWYWDLTSKRAVPASERGPADDVLGPYASRADAENWKDRLEARNEEWAEADKEWEGDDDEAEDAGAPKGDASSGSSW